MSLLILNVIILSNVFATYEALKETDLQFYGSTGTEEYCISETFQPSCPLNEVVVVEEAIFGRKKLGRCLAIEKKENKNLDTADPKVLGCYYDVREMLDPLCSMKKSCQVKVYDLNADVPCYKYLKYYLEVKWSCIRVVQENRHCSVALENEKQHILVTQFSSTTRCGMFGCGSKTQPWTIETLQGQKINIQMVHFQTQSKNATSLSLAFIFEDDRCSPYGHVLEKSNKKRSNICLIDKNNIDKNQPVYVSESNAIEIVLSESALNRLGKQYFLFLLEATGCSDLIPPADAWLKRNENEVIIGCYSTRLRWQLKCQGQRWVGVIGNCSQGPETGRFSMIANKPEEKSENFVVTVVGIAMVGFVICFLIICLGVVLLNRYYAVSKSKVLGRSIPFGNDPVDILNYSGKTILQTGHSKTMSYPIDKTKYNSTNGTNDWTIDCPQETTQYFELDQSLVKNAI